MENVDTGSAASIAELEVSATKGSAEHQRHLGLHHLKQYELGQDVDKNAELAVKWLVKASRTGDEQATLALRECLQKDIGISPENRDVVQWCVKTTALEKQARVAASALFHALNPLEQDVISRDDYLRQVGKVTSSREEQALLEKAGKRLREECLTEEAFVDRMIRKLQGKGTTTLSSLTHPEKETVSETTTAQKWLSGPIQAVMRLADFSMEFAAKQGLTFLRQLIPTQQVHMLLVFFVYSVVSAAALLRIVPIFTFYFGFLAMIVATLQMLYNRRKSRDVQAHASLLQKFDPRLDLDDVQSSFSWNSLTPYIMFFASLVILLLSYSMANKAWIPSSEFAAIAVFATFACFLALSNEYDHLLLLSILCNLGASLPSFLPALPDIPVIGHLLQFLCGPGFSIELGQEFHIHLGVPALLYLVVPVLFIRMAMQNSWKGTYRILVPHLVCLFWWQVALMFYKHSTWSGLVRGLIGWIGLVVAFPLLVVGGAIWLAFILLQWLTFAAILKVFTTVTVIGVAAGLALWSSRGFQVGGFNMTASTKGKILLVVISVFSVIPLMFVVRPHERDVQEKYLSWNNYKRFCSVPQWKETNKAHAQVQCAHFRHMLVSWSGKVKKVVVKSIHNQAEDFVSRLPVGLAEWLRCTYGEHYTTCEEFSGKEKELCKLRTLQDPDRCHLRKMDYYTFELWVTMKVDDDDVHDFRIEARHEFLPIMVSLRPGQKVSFRASLQGELGNLWPELLLFHIQCDNCPAANNATQAWDILPQETGIMAAFRLGKQALYDSLNFFFAPLFKFGAAQLSAANATENA